MGNRLVSITVGLFVLFSFAVGIASAQQRTINFGNGQGTLNYTATFSSGRCGYMGQQQWSEWSYTKSRVHRPVGQQ